MDIIVTTPKSQMKQAAQEAENAKLSEDSYYFRKLGRMPKDLNVGDKVFYVENGAVRGYCILHAIENEQGQVCETSGKNYGDGLFAKMYANTWKWIEPIPMSGFQGWRYSKLLEKEIVVLGDWLDDRPEVKKIITLSDRDSKVFADALINPPEPSETFKRGVANYKSRVRQD